MNAQSASAAEGWSAPADKTGQTDDERIQEVLPLPPPEHLVRFFPIRGTAAETLITETRQNIKQIMAGNDDRLLVAGVGFSVEPGVYLTGRFGVRSEINVVIHADGPEVTPRVPQRELIVPS